MWTRWQLLVNRECLVTNASGFIGVARRYSLPFLAFRQPVLIIVLLAAFVAARLLSCRGNRFIDALDGILQSLTRTSLFKDEPRFTILGMVLRVGGHLYRLRRDPSFPVGLQLAVRVQEGIFPRPQGPSDEFCEFWGSMVHRSDTSM